MTIRLWRIPDYYPNKHIGVYQDPDPGYEDLRFREGILLNDEPEMVFDFHQSSFEKLQKLGCLWTTLSTPLLNQEIASILTEAAPQNFQLIKSKVITANGPINEFSFLNVTQVCDCLDRKKSILRFYETGDIMRVDKFRLKDEECMGKIRLARVKDKLGYIVVSETLFGVLSKLKFKGLHFELDSDGDDFR